MDLLVNAHDASTSQILPNSTSSNLLLAATLASANLNANQKPQQQEVAYSCNDAEEDEKLENTEHYGDFELCQICRAESNGNHFGAVSCAACAAFFRRSIVQKKNYKCIRMGNCVIDSPSRFKGHFCRACRLRKCLEIGMKSSDVQQPRVPAEEKPYKSKKSQQINNPAMPYQNFFTHEKNNIAKNSTDILQPFDQSDQQTSSQSSSSVIRKQLKPRTRKRLGHHDQDSNCGGCQEQSLRKRNKAKRLHSIKRIPTSEGIYNGAPKRDSISQLLNTSTFAEQLLALTKEPVVMAEENEGEIELVDEKFIVKAWSNTPTPPSEHTNNQEHQLLALINGFSQTSESNEIVVKSEYDDCIVEANGCVNNYGSSVFKEGDELETSMPIVPNKLNQCKNPQQIKDNLKVQQPYKSIKSSSSIIDEVLDSYRIVKERRRMLHGPNTLRGMLSRSEPEFRESRLGEHQTSIQESIPTRILIEFLRSIQPFATLLIDDKLLVTKRFLPPFVLFESCYLTYQNNGHNTNRIYHHNFTFIQLSTESPSPLQKLLQNIVEPMANIVITDVEFVGLTLVLLLDGNDLRLSEDAREKLLEARKRLYQDWLAYYDVDGSALSGVERVGEVKRLLQPIQELVASAGSNGFHEFNVFGLTSVDRVLDECFF